MHANGSKLRRLTKVRGEAWNPIWLPRDMGIAFLARVSGTGRMSVMHPDGSDVRRLALRGIEQFTWVAGLLPRRRC